MAHSHQFCLCVWIKGVEFASNAPSCCGLSLWQLRDRGDMKKTIYCATNPLTLASDDITHRANLHILPFYS